MVRIVTDSTADIPDAMAEELGITVVPSYVLFGTESYLDGVELTREQFYEKLATSRVIPTTATPPPGAYEEAYRRLAHETDEIVSIHLAANLSGLYSAAAVAAANVPEVQIAVVDSAQVTMGCGWMAVAAAEAARRGETLRQIVALVASMKPRTWVVAALGTLEFLYRGGRVRWATAMIGTLLQIKPLIEVSSGEVKLLEKIRTRVRSLERVMTHVQALGRLEQAIVLHTDAQDAAEDVADRLSAMVPDWQRLIAPAGVTIASHAGPGAVGVACVAAAR